MNLLLDKIVVLITFYLTPEAASYPVLSLKYTKQCLKNQRINERAIESGKQNRPARLRLRPDRGM